MSELEPTSELPDDMPVRQVRFPTRIKNALFAAGLKTVGEVRDTPDQAFLSLPDFGEASLARRLACRRPMVSDQPTRSHEQALERAKAAARAARD